MAFLNFFSVLLITYSTIFLLKCYNKLSFLQSFGVEISLFQIKWFTQRFNRFFLKCGNWHRNLVVSWFTVGAFVSCLLILPSMMLLVRTLINNLVQQCHLYTDLVELSKYSLNINSGILLKPTCLTI